MTPELGNVMNDSGNLIEAALHLPDTACLLPGLCFSIILTGNLSPLCSHHHNAAHSAGAASDPSGQQDLPPHCCLWEIFLPQTQGAYPGCTLTGHLG